MSAEKFCAEFCQEFSKILAVPCCRQRAVGLHRAYGGDIFPKMKAVAV